MRDAAGADVFAKDRSALLSVGWARSHNCCHDVGWVMGYGGLLLVEECMHLHDALLPTRRPRLTFSVPSKRQSIWPVPLSHTKPTFSAFNIQSRAEYFQRYLSLIIVDCRRNTHTLACEGLNGT